MFQRTSKTKAKERIWPAATLPTTDAMLVRELNQLSVKDREDALEEIHGVHASDMAKKDKEKLPGALQQLQLELDRLVQNSAHPEVAAHKQALQQNSRYVIDEMLRTKFVRADRYDAAAAAVRMIKWFDMGLELFGPVALMRPVRFLDLSANAKQIYMAGDSYVLPTRDPIGRLIGASVADMGTVHPIKDRVGNADCSSLDQC
jgi:uncharacterized protein YaaR (DUF327 family)